MTVEEAAQHVGEAVTYKGRYGVIERIVSLPLVRFSDGTRMQCCSHCLELAGVSLMASPSVSDDGTLF